MSSPDGEENDLPLMAVVSRVTQYAGRIQDLGEYDRLMILGFFAGGVMRLEERVRQLYAEAAAMSYMDALPYLNQVMLALGAPEDWNEETESG